MATMKIDGVRLAGLAAAVPGVIRTTADDAQIFGAEEATKISQSIGVSARRVVNEGLCASDLCYSAAERLLLDLGWERSSVQAVIFVSQTPDYVSPATACTLQARLGLPKTCAAFDINLGCSGYVYGLSVAAQFARSLGQNEKGTGRVLLLVGDTLSRVISPEDRSSVPLFGDAGSATAMECDPAAEAMHIVLGTDGTGLDHLLIPAGGFRRPRDAASSQRNERENGNIRSDEDLFMNGAEVFMFTLCEVPTLVKATLAAAQWDLTQVDAVVMHQANSFMLNHLRKRLKVPDEKFVIALDGFGNTSCASIPLAMVTQWSAAEPMQRRRLMLAGFGIGWSWAGAALVAEDIVISPLVELPVETTVRAAA